MHALTQRCLRDVPFYRKRGGTTFETLRPIARDDIRREPWSFVPDNEPLDQLIDYFTAGTTGQRMPLFAVVTELRSVSATLVPSTFTISLAPSARFETVAVIVRMFCVASVVLTVTLLNRSTNAPPSVKVGFVPVAVTEGGKFAASNAPESHWPLYGLANPRWSVANPAQSGAAAGRRSSAGLVGCNDAVGVMPPFDARALTPGELVIASLAWAAAAQLDANTL